MLGKERTCYERFAALKYFTVGDVKEAHLHGCIYQKQWRYKSALTTPENSVPSARKLICGSKARYLFFGSQLNVQLLHSE
jgi:hypothetical protein